MLVGKLLCGFFSGGGTGFSVAGAAGFGHTRLSCDVHPLCGCVWWVGVCGGWLLGGGWLLVENCTVDASIFVAFLLSF